jgi:hypothetical protein
MRAVDALIAPAFMIPLPEYSPPRDWCFAQSKRTRAAFVFVLIAATLIVEQSLGGSRWKWRTMAEPAMPVWPATNTRFGSGRTGFADACIKLICGGKDTRILARKVFEVGNYHFGHELLERDPVLPAEL